MVLDSEGCNETGWKPGLTFHLCSGARPMAFVWGRWLQRRGPKGIKSQTRTILETINTLYSISWLLKYKPYNSNFKFSSKWVLTIFFWESRDEKRRVCARSCGHWENKKYLTSGFFIFPSFGGSGGGGGVGRGGRAWQGKGRCWQGNESNYFHMWHTVSTQYTLL